MVHQFFFTEIIIKPKQILLKSSGLLVSTLQPPENTRTRTFQPLNIAHSDKTTKDEFFASF